VNAVPEERVGWVGAYGEGCAETGIDDVGEAEVGCVVCNGLEEIEGVQPVDADAGKELFELQEAVEGLVGGEGCWLCGDGVLLADSAILQ
jgi:hypothetical protein